MSMEMQCWLAASDTMAEWSKALVLGTSLRAWVQIPLVSDGRRIVVSTSRCGRDNLGSNPSDRILSNLFSVLKF